MLWLCQLCDKPFNKGELQYTSFPWLTLAKFVALKNRRINGTYLIVVATRLEPGYAPDHVLHATRQRSNARFNLPAGAAWTRASNASTRGPGGRLSPSKIGTSSHPMLMMDEPPSKALSQLR
jgi:hypothetical protein